MTLEKDLVKGEIDGGKIKNILLYGKTKRYSWQTIEEWKEYGLKNKFNKRNSNSLRKSEDKEERSWHKKGQRKKWIKEFEFQKINNLPYQTPEEWVRYGSEKGYNERNPYRSAKSKNKTERSWYGKGEHEDWMDAFAFSKKEISWIKVADW